MRRSPGTVDARHFWVLPEHEFERAVVLLCDGSNRITSFGGRYSQLLASYLDLHLRMMRPHTAVRAPHVNDDPAFLGRCRPPECVRGVRLPALSARDDGAGPCGEQQGRQDHSDHRPLVVAGRRFRRRGAAGPRRGGSIISPTALVKALVFANSLPARRDRRTTHQTVEAEFGGITID